MWWIISQLATKYYEPVVSACKENGVELRLIIREKTDFLSAFNELLAVLQGSFNGKKVGTLIKEAEKQVFLDAFRIIIMNIVLISFENGYKINNVSLTYPLTITFVELLANPYTPM